MFFCRSQKWFPWCLIHRQYKGPSLPSNQPHQSSRLRPRCTAPPPPPLDSKESTSEFTDKVEWYVCFDWCVTVAALWWCDWNDGGTGRYGKACCDPRCRCGVYRLGGVYQLGRLPLLIHDQVCVSCGHFRKNWQHAFQNSMLLYSSRRKWRTASPS